MVAEARRNRVSKEKLDTLMGRFEVVRETKEAWDSQRLCNVIWNLVRTKLREKTQQMKFEEKLDMDPNWFPCKRETKDESGCVVNESGWEVNWKTGLYRQHTAQSMWTYESPCLLRERQTTQSST